MLNKTIKEEMKTIIDSYCKDIQEFSCINQHYVEACGLYCPVVSEWSIDMSGKRNPRCTTECHHYMQSVTQLRAEKMISLFNQIKVDTLDKILTYIQKNPTMNSNEIASMLIEERKKAYVEEIC